ncbi:Nramp family divalent metal transporter [Telluribacter sp.]|jgi:Mn2+/Fe2+ NRAMP family transporter|uniref:Nramp family divalent metal transporter n=1 Tax=Telluribacter sp. TaxID=1978767 RepID=UPI002E0FDD49|nr:Nramp family divalent metal transporter [Telluribacter sp.]
MKYVSLRSGLSSLLFWSVISAAFIGPGTVTTCGLAGATFGSSLLWALVFSTVSTILLQEAAARLTIASGKNLGEILAGRHESHGQTVNYLLAIGVITGCAAYEAGNILGAVAGIQLLFQVPAWLLTLVVGTLAVLFLSIPSTALLTRLLGLVVFLMGIAFVWVGVQSISSLPQLLRDSFVPAFPAGSALVITGLVGTTVVPYNLFLASGIGQGQSVREMRQGLVLAVLIGGLISISIVLGGTLIEGTFSFERAAEVLAQKFGKNGRLLYAIGLFGAGFTSVVTAPFAAGITARTLLGTTPQQTAWVGRGVILIGLVFGVLNIKPVPIIIAAQAANGLLLPFITWQIIRAVNDPALLPPAHRNSRLQTILLYLIFGVTLVLGLNSLFNSVKTFW